eukprot:gnl/TRDRNA2_/TRDRNA2_150961_c1_seq1.p1 gnl/TRDRNA2_/TRDRNA2_150961_c1~~gnl/TRDRNA2_/TRDRNA2_150961_c1_seq1.p1  ORF type:complete len:406 (+),score=37.50 gnl/TRDRNA2_/TRDRNA2_150961_c1_seq1:91-1308(+)
MSRRRTAQTSTTDGALVDGTGTRLNLVPDAQATALCRALAAEGEHPAIIHIDATVEHGKVRQDHGIQVNLSGQISGHGVRREPWWWQSVMLDVHGSGLFAALPGGLGSAAQMMLPMSARIDVPRQQQAEVAMGTEWTGTIVFGAKKLSRGRLESTLAQIVAAGDPPFVFELRHSEGRLLGFLPTRASLLKNGLLSRGTSVRDDGPLADFRRSNLRLFVGFMRWWLCPLLFLLLSWQLWLAPAQFLPHIPNFVGPRHGLVGVASVLPPHPKNMTQAFRLGAIHAQMQQAQCTAENCNHSTAMPLKSMEELLHEASTVLGDRSARKLTPDDMHMMLDEIIRFETQVGVVHRVLGFFTFVNTVWLFAIIGIAFSIGPSLYHLLQPLHDCLRRFIRWVYLNIILPNVIR